MIEIVSFLIKGYKSNQYCNKNSIKPAQYFIEKKKIFQEVVNTMNFFDFY